MEMTADLLRNWPTLTDAIEVPEHVWETNCSLWSLCGNSATGEWLTTAEVTTEDGHQVADAELILCDWHAAALGLSTRGEGTK